MFIFLPILIFIVDTTQPHFTMVTPESLMLRQSKMETCGKTSVSDAVHAVSVSAFVDVCAYLCVYVECHKN